MGTTVGGLKGAGGGGGPTIVAGRVDEEACLSGAGVVSKTTFSS